MQSVCENSTSLFGLNTLCAYLYRTAAWPLSVQQSQLPISPADLLSVSPVWCLSVQQSQLPVPHIWQHSSCVV